MHHLSVEGSPRDMGLQHGESLRGPIRELAQLRQDLILRRMPGWTAASIEQLAREQLVKLERHEAAWQEFQGIAEGAGVGHTALMVLNNYTDMRDFRSAGEGCSAFALRDGEGSICGQTWDMHASARPYVLHLSTKGPRAAEILTLTGCLGLAGVGQGVSVLINNLNCAQTAVNLMWPALVRGMLEQPTAQHAADWIAGNMPCSGHHYLLCDDRWMLGIETTGVQSELIERRASGAVYHTNHYLGRLVEHEMLDRRAATSVPRYEALARYFDGLTRVPTLEEAGNALCSASTPGNVCVPFTGEDASLTCGGLLYDLRRGTGVMFAGTWDSGEHREFRIRS